MIVPPESTNPRGPVRRALRMAALVLPVVLLGGVVVAGIAGPRPEGVPPLPSQPVPDGPRAERAGPAVPGH